MVYVNCIFNVSRYRKVSLDRALIPSNPRGWEPIHEERLTAVILSTPMDGGSPQKSSVRRRRQTVIRRVVLLLGPTNQN